MEIVLLIARLMLVAIFGVAGVAKLADREGSRRALAGFGIPEAMTPLLAWGLPVVEMVIALALLPQRTAWWGATGAAALLLIFLIGISANLARGNAPDCHCFGQLQSEPVSWKVFARNVALALVAGAVVIAGKRDPGPSALAWLLKLKTAETVNLFLGVAGIGLFVSAIILLKRVLKEQAMLFESVKAIKTSLDEEFDLVPLERKQASPITEGLPVGAIAPNFSLAAISGEQISLNDLLAAGKSVLLLFVGPDCWGCKVLLPVVRTWQQEYADQLTVAVLSRSTFAESQAKMAKYELDNLLLDENSSVADDYQTKWTPGIVLIDRQGKIASQIIYGDNAIREFVRNTIASGQLPLELHHRNGQANHIPQVAIRYSVRKIGEPAPSFMLLDLSGSIVKLEDLLGDSVLLLFWHPRCQFCRAMFEDLREWEEQSPVTAPKLVFIASGSEEEIKAMNWGLKSLTLLDSSLDVGSLFGTKQTPAAILIDGEGRIASSLAIGDPNVRALVGLPKAQPVLIS